MAQVEADALTAKLRALIPAQTVERSLTTADGQHDRKRVELPAQKVEPAQKAPSPRRMVAVQ